MARCVHVRGAKGQALAELALIVPIVVLLMMAIFDLGRAVYAHNTIADAARTGGRVAIVNQNQTTIKDAAIAQAVGLGITAGQVTIAYLHIAPNGTIGSPCQPVKVVTCVAEVTVSYQFNAATPLIGGIVGPIDMSSTTRFVVEHEGL